MKRLIFVLLSLLFLSCSKNDDTHVLVMPSLHALHKVNPNYSYKDLFEVIGNFDPEVIGVEIRPEDIKQSNEYLDPFYPDEMIMVKDSFPEITYGIDFYGKAAEGKLLKKEFAKDTLNELGRFFQAQHRINRDSLVITAEKQLGIPGIQEKQKNIGLSYSPQQMINGDYDRLTEKFYRLEDSLLLAHGYEKYVNFNAGRDLRITLNAIELIQQNKGKSVLIIVGANHRNRLVDSLENRSGIELVQDLGLEEDSSLAKD